MKEQISEEFANELLDNFNSDALVNDNHVDAVINGWKEKGYIKQTREDEIKRELEIYQDSENPFNQDKKIIKLQKELIEILDNKLKGRDQC